MKAPRFAVALLILLASTLAADAAEVPIPPAPTAWVTDTAGFLTPQTVDTLDARLQAYETATGHQILVYIAPTTGPAPTEDWTIRAFTKWKVGRKGIADGLVMFVFPTDHKVRIEVGYGLEQTVPDAVASRIIRNTVTPKLSDGKKDEAVVSGIDAILATVGGETVAQAATPVPENSDDDSGTSTIGVIIGILLALAVVAAVGFLISKLPKGKDTYISGGNSGFGFWDVLSIGGSLLGGFSGGGGGGFSGGGGSGGGGGATGSW